MFLNTAYEITPFWYVELIRNDRDKGTLQVSLARLEGVITCGQLLAGNKGKEVSEALCQ